MHPLGRGDACAVPREGPDHWIRGIKGQMTRDILTAFDKRGIAVGATRQQAVNAG